MLRIDLGEEMATKWSKGQIEARLGLVGKNNKEYMEEESKVILGA